jgi:isopenicillin N synthase-like dioxygenase
VVRPCAEWGLFHVVGHGLSDALLAQFDAAMKCFFAFSAEAKRSVRRTRDNAWGYYDEERTKNRLDWKEVFDYGAERAATEHSDGVNRWPEEASDLRQPLVAYHDACRGVALALLRSICASLGLSPTVLDSEFEGDSSFVRLNRYAACPDPAPADAPLFPERGHLGIHHHADAGALTVLYQNEVAGLQVMHRGRFVLVEPVSGTLTINLGDMLQVCSNDRYVSAVHRVLANPTRDRYSAPFFLNPSYDTVYQPLAELLEAGERPLYRPISWSHFRDQRSAGDYADYGAEIQIADYRI